MTVDELKEAVRQMRAHVNDIKAEIEGLEQYLNDLEDEDIEIESS